MPVKVMLLTPAFRNMDSTLEEAARVGGAGNLLTMMKITLPFDDEPARSGYPCGFFHVGPDLNETILLASHDTMTL